MGIKKDIKRLQKLVLPQPEREALARVSAFALEARTTVKAVRRLRGSTPSVAAAASSTSGASTFRPPLAG